MSVQRRLHARVDQDTVEYVKQLRGLRIVVSGATGSTPVPPPAPAGGGPDSRLPRQRGRERRATGVPAGHAVRSAWGFTGALLVIVLGSVLLVDELHERANVQRQAQVVASELEQDAAELRVAEDALMAGKQVAEADAEISDEFADLHATTTALRELGDDDVASAIERDLRTVESALRSQLASVRGRRAGGGRGDRRAADRSPRSMPSTRGWRPRSTTTRPPLTDPPGSVTSACGSRC